MRRHAIGVIALVLLLTAAWFFIRPPNGPLEQEWQAACGRIGTVMLVIWLAYDQLRRLPVWLWWTLPVVFVTLAIRPRWLLILVPVVIVLAILRPRPGPRRR
jgi:hypothetical protein